VENVLAAGVAAARAGVSHQAIAAAVRTFKAVEHRLEFVRNLNGIDFYNDSKATSVDATLKALEAFPGGLWVILGGKDKGLDYAALRETLAAKARAALLIGAAAGKIASQLQGAVPLVDADPGRRCRARLRQCGARRHRALRWPAPASISSSYQHRGEVFKQIVNRLQGENYMAQRLKTD
jgi:UDP-N-acetylmuramoylalanine--D-glutamate ligase